MPNVEPAPSEASLCVRNIGGISETTVDIPPGVTVLEGRNATNRTSLLQSIMAVMGSDDISVKGDADEAHVQVELGGDTYERGFQRADGVTATSGDPYLEDPTVADLFAFLLETNKARRAVVRDDGLRALLMRPVDTDQIQAEIDRLERERDRVDEQLEELDSLKRDLPRLEERRNRLEAEIEEIRDKLTEKEAEIEGMDANVGEQREEKRELESRLEALRDLRSDLETVREKIDRQEESIESLRAERSELRAKREELPETPMGDHDELEERLSRLRQRKQSLETEVSTLQDVVQFNEDLLAGEKNALSEALDAPGPDGSPTDELLGADDVVCWTCGSEVQRGQIKDTLDTLRSVRQTQLDEVSELEHEIESLSETQRKRERQQRNRDAIDRKLADTEDELERREDRLDKLRERRDSISEEIEAAEAAVEALESETFSEILDRHKEANQFEFKLGQLESELDDVTDRIADIGDRLADADSLEQRREELTSELERQRTRIDRLERRAVDAFNAHMDEILDILGYENLARIWIERVRREVRDGRQTVEKTEFDLHVVRTTDSGTTYEDKVDHLSESEREITGLVFALAGYLVHDVHETVPFMLLDSLEAIDSERLAALISYFAEFVQYLVVALLPEDAQTLPDEYTRVTDI